VYIKYYQILFIFLMTAQEASKKRAREEPEASPVGEVQYVFILIYFCFCFADSFL